MFGRSREVEENLNGFAHSRRTSTRATSKNGEAAPVLFCRDCRGIRKAIQTRLAVLPLPY